MIRRSLPLLLAMACLSCGGSSEDGGGAVTFTVISIMPNTSSTVNGGDVVSINGTNFLTVQVFRVTFGGQLAAILNTTQNVVTVRTPPAPGRLPGTVAVEVFAGLAPAIVINNAYTFADPSVNPVPQTILPTTFTATGAETFQITGQNLGQPGSRIDVTFAGVGTVLATVSTARDIATGVAPVSAATPPAGLVTVSINNGLGNATVPTQIRYDFGPPSP